MGNRTVVVGATLVIVVLVVIAVVIAGLMFKRFGDENRRRQEAVRENPRQVLRYRVPEGQDPAAVLVALTHGGFEAVTSPDDTQMVVVQCPMGADEQREEVRTLIENEAALNLEDDPHNPGTVRFTDE